MKVAANGSERKAAECLSYHIAWIAKFGLPPTVPNGPAEYSHRYHQPCCVNPDHGIWENGGDNKGREICRQGSSHLLLKNPAAKILDAL